MLFHSLTKSPSRLLSDTTTKHNKPRPFTTFITAFTLLFLALVYASRTLSQRDPDSIFFDPSIARRPQYSAHRRAEAREFIRRAEVQKQGGVDRTRTPDVCVAVASVERKGRTGSGSEMYFSDTVGSILAGLDTEERKEENGEKGERRDRGRIHLVMFIAQTNQSSHPDFQRGWMENVADSILSYENVVLEDDKDKNGEKMKEIERWEVEDAEFKRKGLFDYGVLLRACEGTGAPYTLVLEDDVLAVEGWFPRMEEALREVEERTERMGRESFLYLRLFYNDALLGYNSEQWPTYLLASLTLTTLVLLFLLLLRFLLLPTLLRSILTPKTILTSTLIFTPALILLFFASGKNTTLPLRAGVHPLPEYGCCTQGMVFQSQRIGELRGLFEGVGEGYVDQILEAYADRKEEEEEEGDRGVGRWVVVPSLLQHMGAESSKGSVDMRFGGGGQRVGGAEAQRAWGDTPRIWNYGFERYSIPRQAR